jgi:release factor glutamine methyltransferase
MSTISAALAAARKRIEASEARLLLRRLLDCSAAHIAGHGDSPIDASIAEAFSDLVERRRAGEPIAYLTGAREFYGRVFSIGPGVLIPRPETELLIDVVLAKIDIDAAVRVLDMGTGSGCLAITLALELPKARVMATDTSSAAIEIARNNSVRLGVCDRFRLVESDWFSAFTDECFDVIVSNPPYIANGDTHLASGDLRFEPRAALASGDDGLDAIRSIVAGAGRHLARGGLLLIEHGYDQARPVAGLLAAHGFTGIKQHRDIAGILRVSAARLG